MVSLVVVTLVFFVMWDASKPKSATDNFVSPPQPVLQQPPSDPLAIPSSPVIDAAVSSSLSSPSPSLSADPYLTDAQGCYHTVPPKDPLPHIVAPPAGPVSTCDLIPFPLTMDIPDKSYRHPLTSSMSTNPLVILLYLLHPGDLGLLSNDAGCAEHRCTSCLGTFGSSASATNGGKRVFQCRSSLLPSIGR